MWSEAKYYVLIEKVQSNPVNQRQQCTKCRSDYIKHSLTHRVQDLKINAYREKHLNLTASLIHNTSNLIC